MHVKKVYLGEKSVWFFWLLFETLYLPLPELGRVADICLGILLFFKAGKYALPG